VCRKTGVLPNAPRSDRSKAEEPKVRIGFRLAADVVEGVKATGKGYNARVEMILRDALAKGLLDAGGVGAMNERRRDAPLRPNDRPADDITRNLALSPCMLRCTAIGH
jgi:BrnA antitoxin of type II toxin-antitoxin system